MERRPDRTGPDRNIIYILPPVIHAVPRAVSVPHFIVSVHEYTAVVYTIASPLPRYGKIYSSTSCSKLLETVLAQTVFTTVRNTVKISFTAA